MRLTALKGREELARGAIDSALIRVPGGVEISTVPELIPDEVNSAKFFMLKTELTSLLEVGTDNEAVFVNPWPISALPVKAVVELAGTIKAHP
jgi:hypothetical protein